MKQRTFMAVWLVSILAAGATFAPAAKGETMNVYAAAVAKAPLTSIAAEYEKATGNKVNLVFDTAGATEKKFEGDSQAALLITTSPLIRNATSTGALHDGTSTTLGSTFAGIAVTPGTNKPDVSSPEKLRAALLAAKRVAVSDPARGATVGTHFMKVIEALGVKDDVLRKVTFAPDGVETMRRVVAGEADFGVSQSSEIVQAGPDVLAGPFPKEFALVTEFSIWRRNDVPPAVADFIARLTDAAGRQKFTAEGIVPPSGR